MLGLASCSQDKDPVYTPPTRFVLNEPAMANQYLILDPSHTFELVCSQPDYGYAAVATYSVEVALTENGFDNPETYKTIDPVGNGTNCRMTLKDDDLSVALCLLHGFDTEETYQELPAQPVYFRAVSQLKGVESSVIKSNVVCQNNVKFYFAVPQPNHIYLVGSPEGWAGPTEGNADHYADWRLFEKREAIGSNIYYGTFTMPAAPMFRFYTKLSGWDDDSYGAQEADSAVDVALDPNGQLVTPIVKGKGSFSFPDYAGGVMNIVVDMNEMTMTVTTE